MPTSNPKITIFLAPDGQAAGVLDVLTDLSAAGLVDPFLWFREERVTGTRAEGILVESGRRSPVGLQRLLADLTPTRIRLCVIVPVNPIDRPVAFEAEQHLTGLVNEGVHNAPITKVRCLLARTAEDGAPQLNGTGGQPAEDVLEREGWHNVLLAPEDRDGPTAYAEPLTATDDPVEVGRHAAPMVAGLLALWTGVDETPLDDLRMAQGIRVGRAFYRSVDAREVEHELRRRTLATYPELPQPKVQGRTAGYADPQGACWRMEKLWWDENWDKLVSSEVLPKKVKKERLGWRNALKMLFKYLWAALKGLPGEMINAWENTAATAFANTVHSICFGSGESAFEVVVKGRDRSGFTGAGPDVLVSLHQLDDRLASERAYQSRPHGDQRKVWNDYVWGAFTLADAGDRGYPHMPPLENNGHIAVLQSVSDCAPSSVDDFVVTGKLASFIDPDLIRTAPGDVRGIAAIREALTQGRQNMNVSDEASKQLQELARWEVRYAHGYSTLVAKRVFGNLQYTVDRIEKTIQQVLAALKELRKLDELRKKRSRLLLVLGILVLLGGAVLWYLGANGHIAGRTAWLIGAALVIGWLMTAVIRFLREQREIFWIENRRRKLLSELEAAQQNLELAMLDLHRLEEAYEQYLVWSRIVGEVLRAPFGPEPERPKATVHIGFGLPRAAKTADAEVLEDPTKRAADALRSETFGAGWLSAPWRAHTDNVGRQLGILPLESNPALLFDLRGTIKSSYLKQWADHLLEHGTAPITGDKTWQEVRDLLDTEDGELAKLKPRLLASVRSGTGREGPKELEEFLRGVEQESAEATQRFTPRVFSAQALADEYSQVDQNSTYEVALGLTRVAVLVQLTAPHRSYMYVFGPQHASEDEAPVSTVGWRE